MIGDNCRVESLTIIEIARRAAGLSQAELARIARTTQSAISEYERRRKSPALEVVERLLAAADAELMVVPQIAFERVDAPGLSPFYVPNRVWPLLPPLCFSRVRMPDSRRRTGQEVWDLSDREDRIRFYELVLCEGSEDMILWSVDGALLVDAWPDLDLPKPVREAWKPVVRAAFGRRDVRDVRST
jgi:transcriptional regulator with XRE-family HTH domain